MMLLEDVSLLRWSGVCHIPNLGGTQAQIPILPHHCFPLWSKPTEKQQSPVSLCTTVWCCRVLDPLQLQVISWKLQLVIGFGGEGTSRRFGDRLSSTEQKQKQEIKPFYSLFFNFFGKIRNKNYLGCSNPKSYFFQTVKQNIECDIYLAC